MMIKKASKVTIALLMSLALSSAAAAAPATPAFDDVLVRFEAAVRLPRRALIYAEERGTFAHNGTPDYARYGSYRLTYKRDGDRLDVTEEDIRADASGNFTVQGPSFRFVVSGDRSLLRQTNEAGKSLGVAYQDRATAAARAEWVMLAGRALEGVLDGDGVQGSVAGALRAGGDKSIAVETVDVAKGAYVLRSAGRSGAHALWVDPKTFLPVRIEVVRSANDLFNDQPLEAGVAERKTVCDAFESSEFSGRVLPVAVRLTETTRFVSGDVDQAVVEHRNTQVELQPEFVDETDFVMDMPDGTTVLFEPRIGVNYEWRGGKPVPLVDPVVLAAVRGAVDSVEPLPRKSDGARSPISPAVAGSAAPGSLRVYVTAGLAVSLLVCVAAAWKFGGRGTSNGPIPPR